MIKVEEWILESRDKRIAHIIESEPCIERGGNSTVHRGILAQYLNTNLPSKIDLCHYCGNGKCSNPKHLYWGTRKENVEDSIRHGTRANPWTILVEKIGIDAAREHMKSIGDPAIAGAGNKGKPKSLSHRKKLSLNRRGGKPKGWRKINAHVSQSAEEADLKSV
jgi:hypothetical protein